MPVTDWWRRAEVPKHTPPGGGAWRRHRQHGCHLLVRTKCAREPALASAECRARKCGRRRADSAKMC